MSPDMDALLGPLMKMTFLQSVSSMGESSKECCISGGMCHPACMGH